VFGRNTGGLATDATKAHKRLEAEPVTRTSRAQRKSPAGYARGFQTGNSGAGGLGGIIPVLSEKCARAISVPMAERKIWQPTLFHPFGTGPFEMRDGPF
jgi:hypothetical protein